MKLFPGQQTDESTLLILHRHWLPFAQEAFRVFLLVFLPVVLWFVWTNFFGVTIDATSAWYVIVAMGGALYYPCLVILLYGFWLDYYLDEFIVTNKRVVDIEQNGLFDRTVSEQPVDRIQDVTSEMKGIFSHAFRYGNVYIQTAGKEERFIFENVENPELVVKTILSLTDTLIKPRPQPTDVPEKK